MLWGQEQRILGWRLGHRANREIERARGKPVQKSFERLIFYDNSETCPTQLVANHLSGPLR